MSEFDEKDKEQENDSHEIESRKETGGNEDSKEKAEPEKKENVYEDVCFICRRPESKTGKMFKLPNNISVCNDCMHKTMDTVSQFDYQGMLNNPAFMNDLNKTMSDKGYPNIRFVNISDLQGEGGIPNKQKIRKKKKEPGQEPVLDIRNIPPPHRIKASWTIT